MKGKIKGKAGFIEYYRELFSSDEDFQIFLNNLSSEHLPILRFATNNEVKLKQLWAKQHLPWQISTEYSNALLWPTAIPAGTELPGYAEHLFFPMNPSSLQPVLALDPKPGEVILDACAAPGGKALFIADLMGDAHTLYANDSSGIRRQRLRTILSDYRHGDVQVIGQHAETLFKKYPRYFDKILLDAPCSSERHVWSSPKHLAEWSPSRIKRLYYQQVALINGLWLALKPGGSLVYSTCAVNTMENEGVIEQFLKKHPEAKLVSQQRIWPDATTHDPMFVTIVDSFSK